MTASIIETSYSVKNQSSSIAKKCIQRDLDEIKNCIKNSSIIFVDQIDDDLLHLEAAILGPMSTSYDEGIFLLDIKLPEQFPFLPPQSITFKRAIMHPNVNEYGRFLSDLLKPESWSPVMTIKNLLEHIWARLAVPDIYSNECDLTRAHSYKTDKENFEKMAREYSMKYAAAT